MAQYLKPDSNLGYVENRTEIEFLKFNNLRHVVLGCMLGDFDEVGTYIVSPDVKKELISMEKYIVQTFDNVEVCKSTLKLDKQISFMVTFEGNKATLSLVEKLNFESNFSLNSGTYSNINEYVLDSVETSGEIDRNVIYQRWNINPYGGQVVDIFNCDDAILQKYFGIVNRFKYLLETNKILLQKEEELEEVEAEYSNEILAILEHYPKLKKEVMQTVKETLTEKKNAVSIQKPFFAKTLNEILENSIQKNIEILDEKEKQSFLEEKQNATLNLNIKREDTLNTKHEKTHIENSPNVVKVQTNSTYQNQTITELGTELVSANKEVENRLSNNNVQEENNNGSDLIRRAILAVGAKNGVELSKKDKEENTQRDKLIATVTAAGFGALVGGAAGAVVGAVAGAAVAEVVEEVKQETKKPETKKPEVKKPEVKKPQVKKPQAQSQKKKPEVKKQQPQKSTETETNKPNDQSYKSIGTNTPPRQKTTGSGSMVENLQIKRTNLVDVNPDLSGAKPTVNQQTAALNTPGAGVENEHVGVEDELTI